MAAFECAEEGLLLFPCATFQMTNQLVHRLFASYFVVGALDFKIWRPPLAVNFAVQRAFR